MASRAPSGRDQAPARRWLQAPRGRPWRGTLGALRRLATRAVGAVTVLAVVLVVWPWAASPFGGPKWLVTCLAAAASLALLPREGRRPGPVALAALGNLGVCALSFALRDGASPWWTLAGPVLIACLSLAAPPVPWSAVAWAGGLGSLVVALQALGLDPFASFGPQAEGARLVRYGTLGNPDFVASVLGVTGPLTVVGALQSSGTRGRLAAGSALLQLLGLALLGSFATTLSLGAAAMVALAASRQIGRAHV